VTNEKPDWSQVEGSRFETSADEVPTKEYVDGEQVRHAYSTLDFDEKELFDVPAHRRETRRSGQADLKEVAHTLHQELDEEMGRGEVAEIYNKLQ
jgi:hypothetical protein